MSKYERELCMCEENYKLSLHNSITIHYAFEGDQGGTGKYLIHQIQITKDKQLEVGVKSLKGHMSQNNCQHCQRNKKLHNLFIETRPWPAFGRRA